MKNICKEDLDAMKQIQDSFGFKLINPDSIDLKIRDKRQIAILATIAITSLVTYFSTKELVNMSTSDDDDLVDSTNHIIKAVQDHENRIVRMESEQKLLKEHLKRLTEQMVIGIKTDSTFFDMFAVSTYASSLSKHVKEIQEGVFTLLNQNKLHPNLVSWEETVKAINELREKAIAKGKELLLDNNNDIFQLKGDFVAFENGLVKVLVHIPVISSGNKMKLFKYIPSPQHNFAQSYQFIIENDDTFLAVNSEATLFTTMTSLDSCISMRDTYLCQKNMIHKASKNNCLFNLYMCNEETRETCEFKLRRFVLMG